MTNSEPSQRSFFSHILTPSHFVTQWLILALVAAAALPTTYYLGARSRLDQSESAPASSSPEEQASARLLTVKLSQLNSAGPAFLRQTFTGIVTPARSSLLASKSIGRVEDVTVRVGDRVEANHLVLQLDVGQLLAQESVARASLAAAQSRLQELKVGPRSQDIEQAEAQVAELDANVRLSRANFERIADLRQSSAISRQEYDESRFALQAMEAKRDSAAKALERLQEGTRAEQIVTQQAVVTGLKAQIERIEADLRDQRIVAPFAGTIQARFVDEGTVVSPGQSLIQIVESAPYEIRLGLPSDLVGELTESNLLVTNGTQSLAASILRTAPAIQETTRTREVILGLSKASSQLVDLGSAVTVSVRRPTHSEGFWVPTQALTAGPRGLWAVYVSIPHEKLKPEMRPALDTLHSTSSQAVYQIERRQVELVRAQGEWSEIQGPLSSQEFLVTEGVHKITPGQLVHGTFDDPSQLAQKPKAAGR